MPNDHQPSHTTKHKRESTDYSQSTHALQENQKKSPRQKLWASIFALKSSSLPVKELNEKIALLITSYTSECCESLSKENKYNSASFLFLWPKAPLRSRHLDELYESLKKHKDKDIYLFLDSVGGRIEPAFQISKVCNKYAKNFFVVIPRQAKSAATLLALGASKIYMGDLSELGPIDPQVRGLPVLALQEAIHTLLEQAENHPTAAPVISDVLTRHLNMQILGWMNRLPQSALQYAEKLLALNHKNDNNELTKVAHKLVYGYKDHGFVIDSDEAKNIFAPLKSPCHTNSNEGLICHDDHLLSLAEDMHHEISLLEWYINEIYQRPDFQLRLDIIGAACTIRFERKESMTTG